MPLVANNAASRLAASIGATDTQIRLQAGTGSAFQAPSGDWFPITLINPSGEFKIMHYAARDTDVLSVVRAHSVNVSNNGSGDAHNNLQPTLVTNMTIET